jgi:NhaP-type Na+/H+ or K+/H+ antiporter
VFVFGYIAYATSEVLDHSGIISVLASGILLSHYSWYNLSPQAKTASSIAVQVAGYLMEAFVFSYLGLTIFSYLEMDWSFGFSVIMILVLLVGRYTATIGIVKCLDLAGFNSQIPTKELIFIGYGGMIRGAVSFACVLRLDKSLPHRDVIVTTALVMVSMTTVCCGATVATMQKILFGKELEEKKREKEEKERRAGGGGHGKDESHHEVFMHPNLEISEVGRLS